MDSETIIRFFTRPEKSLLGVCSTIAHKFKLPPVGVRAALIVLTLLFIPLGVIVYMGSYLVFNKKKGKMVTFGLLGALLGIPLSYYFQSEIIKNLMGMFSYLKDLPDVVDGYGGFIGNGGDIIFNILLSIVIFALIGGAVGYYMDKNEKSNNPQTK